MTAMADPTTDLEVPALPQDDAPAQPSGDRLAAAVALASKLGRVSGAPAPSEDEPAIEPPQPAAKAPPVEPPPDLEAELRARRDQRLAKANEGQAQQVIADLQAKLAALEARLGQQPAKPDPKALATTPLATLKAMGFDISPRDFLRAAHQEVLNPSAAQLRAEVEQRLAQVQPTAPAADPAEVARKVFAEEAARRETESAFRALATPEAFPLAARMSQGKLIEAAYALVDEFGPEAFADVDDAAANRKILSVLESRQRKAFSEAFGADALEKLLPAASQAAPKTTASSGPKATPRRGATTITSDLQAAGSHRRPQSLSERVAAATRLAQQQMDRR